MKKILICLGKILLFGIAAPFAIIPAICIAGMIALDKFEDAPTHIMKHANLLHRGNKK